jgi:hypothetical protein
MMCPTCRVECIEVRGCFNKLAKFDAHPQGEVIRTVCPRCRKWFGYRPVETKPRSA